MQSFLDLQYGFLEVSESAEKEVFKIPEPKKKKSKKLETDQGCENPGLESDATDSDLLVKSTVKKEVEHKHENKMKSENNYKMLLQPNGKRKCLNEEEDIKSLPSDNTHSFDSELMGSLQEYKSHLEVDTAMVF